MIVRTSVARSARTPRRGFTLIEVVAVTAILMVLIGLATFAVTRQMQTAKVNEAYIKMGKIEQAAKQYYIEAGSQWPGSVMELVQPTAGGAPIMEGGLAAVTDPWGQQFQFSVETDAAGSERVVIMTTSPTGQQLTWRGSNSPHEGPAMTVRRPGLTLIELLAVTVILLALVAILAPTLRFFQRDANILAAADIFRGRIADARGEAMEHGRPYRLAVSQDGTKVRIAPDDQNFDTATVTTDEAAPRVAEEGLPKDVTAASEPQDGTAPAVDADGWTRVATFQPDGTCREDAVVIRLRQPNMYPILIRIRGLTGAATVESLKTQRGDQP